MQGHWYTYEYRVKLHKEAQGSLGHYVEDLTHYRNIVGGM